MQISSQNKDKLYGIFGIKMALIGDIHCMPLPGTPRYKGNSMAEIIDRALLDAKAYIQGGMDGVIVENHGDIPFLHPDEIGHEIVAAMTAITCAVKNEFGVPTGVNILANGAIQSLAVAKASGAEFIRVNQWVNAYIANEGLIEGKSGSSLRYRKAISAEEIAIFADVHVKHGSHSIVGDRSLTEQARDVEFYDADVAIATGNRTGDSVPPEEISEIRNGTRLPVIAGSGISVDNAEFLMRKLNGAIVGSSLKRDGVWWNEVQIDKVKALVEIVERLRAC
ncbi:MAG: BtpA/SgcQ family protein [Spirochaetaceae bacterium]|jgi:membrane complex biogenesis BtpA family protein|nr:BtpA/SgcQ family protein [Spirochaetaceae bacterium]